jgi:hypothetical protein
LYSYCKFNIQFIERSEKKGKGLALQPTVRLELLVEVQLQMYLFQINRQAKRNTVAIYSYTGVKEQRFGE